jgi:hypothetical protein
MIVATMLATSALLVAFHSPANAGRYEKPGSTYRYDDRAHSDDMAPDLHGRVSRSYAGDRERRRHVAYKRTKRDRNYGRYSNGPWGPFAGPPGLF